MIVLSETLAIAAYPGKVILSDYKTVHGAVELNKDNCVKFLNNFLKVWINLLRSFLLDEQFNIIDLALENETYQISKVDHHLWINIKNYCYIFTKTDVFLILSEYPKMYILSLCLPPEICLLKSCMLEKFESKLLEHFKETNNFDFDLENALSPDSILNLIKQIVSCFGMTISPFFAYNILSSHKKNFKYLLQARTMSEFVNLKESSGQNSKIPLVQQEENNLTLQL